jgi:hypothetical protein
MWIYTSQHMPLKMRFETNGGGQLMVRFEQAQTSTYIKTRQFMVSEMTAAAQKGLVQYYYDKIMFNSDWSRPAESQAGSSVKVYRSIKSIGVSHISVIDTGP